MLPIHVAFHRIPSRLTRTMAFFLLGLILAALLGDRVVVFRDNNAASSARNAPPPISVQPLVLRVCKTGDCKFERIQEAIDSIPPNLSMRLVIHIGPGNFTEKVHVPVTKNYITFQGAGRDRTFIKWQDREGALVGKLRMATFRTASVAVEADYFIARDISFENTAFSTPSIQAVALRVSGDKAAFYNCGFYGHQDTLYDHRGRHFFKNCTIYGSEDFIFGNGRSVYQRCLLVSNSQRRGALTAQARRAAHEKTGFAFVNCKVKGSGRPLLGRAWRPYSRVVFIRTRFDVPLDPQGLGDFGFPDRRKTAFIGVYNCRGSGFRAARKSPWVTRMTAKEAKPFMDLSFIDARQWLPHF